jgi:hypothetical protein
MSKQEISSAASSLIVVATPAPHGAGRYQAQLYGDDRVLCVSRAPFFDAARELVAIGYDPNTELTLRHAGSNADSLIARLGTAASLTVEETGYGPQFRHWKPIPALAATPRIASDERAAITLAVNPIQGEH